MVNAQGISRRGFVIGAAGAAAMATFCGAPLFSLADEAPATETPYEATDEADLIVVGAGGAGLSAAVAAYEAGAARVIVLEANSYKGGSLALTGGSMSAAETIIQEEDGIEDSLEDYKADLIRIGTQYGGVMDEAMIDLYVAEDKVMFQWLWDHGLSEYEFRTDSEGRRAVFAPEHELYTIPRTYKTSAKNPEKYKGAAFEVLDTFVETVDAIEVVFNTTAVELVPNSKGQVTGVVATDADGNGTLYTGTHGVVMCTGGYGANRKLLTEFNEYGSEYLIGCGPMSNGRGLQMMQKMGGTLVNMDAIPTFPMGLEDKDNPGHGSIASTYVWKAGGICVNKNGERFMNENDPSPSAREELLITQPDAVQYDIYTDKILADLTESGNSYMFDAYYGPEDSKGHYLISSSDTLEGLAEAIGIPADTFVKTVEDYNAAVDSGEPDAFGRTYDEEWTSYKVANNKIEGDMFYAIPIKALCVMTLGGIKCDTNMSVLDEAGNQIPGLYAGGEVVGGIWGKFVNSGCGVMGALTFGRVSGTNCQTGELAEGYEVKPASEILSDDMFEVETAAVEEIEVSDNLADGTYTATVDGQEGPMEVSVTIEGGVLTGCEVVSNNETAAIGGNAIPELTEQVVAAGGPNIDGVAGATLTSNRVRDAVTACLEQAAQA